MSDKKVVWTNMGTQNLLQQVIWYLDKRLFRWDHLPALAKLDIIRKSYLLLLILPLLDKVFSPIIESPEGVRIKFNLGWIEVLPEGESVLLELGIPFTWDLIYFMVLFTAIGAIIYEIACPVIVNNSKSKKVTKQLILQEFRKAAMQLFATRRMNHFMNNFLGNYSTNYESLKVQDNERLDTTPLPEGNSKERLNDKSVYFLAEKMNLDQSKLDDALETIIWFSNESRAIARWIAGVCLCVAIGLFIVLISQGLYQIISL